MHHWPKQVMAFVLDENIPSFPFLDFRKKLPISQAFLSIHTIVSSCPRNISNTQAKDELEKTKVESKLRHILTEPPTQCKNHLDNSLTDDQATAEIPMQEVIQCLIKQLQFVHSFTEQ